jgi:hypothetical protein
LETFGIEGRPGNVKRDCTVRAFAVASGVDYDMAYLMLAMSGRRNNCGARMHDWIKAYQAIGLCLPADRIDLYTEPIPSDNVIVLVPGHIYTIRNGVHSDGEFGRRFKYRKFRGAWRIPIGFEPCLTTPGRDNKDKE